MNATVNGSSCFDVFNSEAARIGQTFAYCLIFVVSLVGNSLIEIVVYKTPTLRKPINFFIASMAMSDLLYPIFLVPWKLTELHSNSWLISGSVGQALCKVAPFFNGVSVSVSVQSLVLITVDRFAAVVFPLRSPLISSKLCPYFILATWIVAVAFCSPFLLALKLVEFEGQLRCVVAWNEAFAESYSLSTYFLTGHVVFICIPFALEAVLYSIIVIKIHTQVLPGEQSANAEQLRKKRNRNVLKMAIAIVLGFALSWLLWSIMRMIFFYDSDLSSSCSFSIYYEIFYFFSRSNCAINPLICFVFSGNYQEALRGLFRCFTSNTDQN